jgi:pyruvate kinase
VANAVLDGTDAVMLSEETAIGSYPTQAVQVLHRVSVEAEAHLDHGRMLADSASPCVPELTGAISSATCDLAAAIGAAAIITATSSGRTTRLVARLRPGCPVLGITTSAAAARQLTLSWGVVPAIGTRTHDETLLGGEMTAALSRHGLATTGDRVVITAGLPLGESQRTNAIRVAVID